ncbi:hypothetical protein SADUNF_Sadunf06G0137100 [Salix dunnii]|uniref:Uncharacterized protein n=1 Tax=Salix dunnii TaxID=1413687 RepID=A0A835MX66_9ROSI|nr:hypothetical protein SADUNF_Sadunf06G0137100 [Salix dunnii]
MPFIDLYIDLDKMEFVELLEANLLTEDATQHLTFNMIARRIQMREMTWDTVYPHLQDVQENKMIIV